MGRRDAGAGPHGLAVVDKPAGWTSHDVVARCRKLLLTRKVGHSGTLDPDATGVLLVGAGHATRLLRFLGDLPKTYVGEVVLGATTTTLDDSGEVLERFAMDGVAPEDVARAAAGFVGEILQVPPMVSARSVGGRRLHELAREGIEVEREARPVTIHALAVEPTDDPLVHRIEVTCSSGTYVRTLAADIGEALGGGAHLRRLRRTAIGPHDLAGATPLEDVSAAVLLPPRACVAHLPTVAADAEGAVADVRHGKVLADEALGVPAGGGGPWAVVDRSGDLLAVYERFRAGLVKPTLVLPSP